MSSSKFPLKRLSEDAVQRAIEKVHLYRVLNLPRLAESICHDILAVEPENEKALQELILSLADQYGSRGFRVSHTKAADVIARLPTDYQRAYFSGLDAERRALAVMQTGAPGYAVYEWLRRAMGFYETAMEHRPAGNDDAILRWNTCARILNANPGLTPDDDNSLAMRLGD